MKTYSPPKIVKVSVPAKAPSGRRIVGALRGTRVANPGPKAPYKRLPLA